jgi:hypothetical protein
VLIVCLVEENIFSVISLRGVLLKNTVSRDTVLHTELLPEFVTNYTTMTKTKAYFGYRTDPLEVL